MEALVTVHYTFMVILLILLAYTIGRFYMNASAGKQFEKFEKMQAMSAMAISHIQLIIGLILLFFGKYSALLSDMGSTMKDSATREIAVEHPVTMLLGIILITIGYSKGKRAEDDTKKFKTIATFYLIGLILILIRIPWGRIMQ
jgi:H+/gluconate symporter-like permease